MATHPEIKLVFFLSNRERVEHLTKGYLPMLPKHAMFLFAPWRAL